MTSQGRRHFQKVPAAAAQEDARLPPTPPRACAVLAPDSPSQPRPPVASREPVISRRSAGARARLLRDGDGAGNGERRRERWVVGSGTARPRPVPRASPTWAARGQWERRWEGGGGSRAAARGVRKGGREREGRRERAGGKEGRRAGGVFAIPGSLSSRSGG